MASVSGDEDYKPFIFLGKDIKTIPCFRNSNLYGIIGGFGMGIGYFMCTSQISRATHFGFGSFIVISCAYWSVCRYNYSETEKKLKELQDMVKSKINDVD